MTTYSVTSTCHTSDGFFVDMVNNAGTAITIKPINKAEYEKYPKGSVHEMLIDDENEMFVIVSVSEPQQVEPESDIHIVGKKSKK